MVDYANKWLCSYETIRFDTADGDLGLDEYARDPEGGYYIRTRPPTEAQFEHVDEEYDLGARKEVRILEGTHAYYDEFLTAAGAEALWGAAKAERVPAGGILRRPSSAQVYWDTARVANHPQPARVEQGLLCEMLEFCQRLRPSRASDRTPSPWTP